MTHHPSPSKPLIAPELATIFAGGINWRLRGPKPAPELLAILDHPDDFFPELAEIPPRGQGGTSVGQTSGYFLKRYNYHRNRLTKYLKNQVRTEPARFAFDMGVRLAEAGISTPAPYAIGTQRRAGLLLRAYLITEAVSSPRTLLASKDGWPAACQQAAELIAALHEGGFIHGDLNPSNLLFDPSGRLFLVDLDTTRFSNGVPLNAALRELARFSRNVPPYSGGSRSNCLRFLKEYCRRRSIENWKMCWKGIEKMNLIERERLERKKTTMETQESRSRQIIRPDSVRAAAESLAAAFESAVTEIDYEWKGVLFSEMLFVAACCSLLPVNRIVESGRARGQSTHVLAKSFPDKPIVSIEFDERSPDRPFAEARLRSFKNVELLFGDSMVLLPKLLKENDAVMIDGPKHFRALRLAARLLRTKKPALVFLHDVPHGCPERKFLERQFPEAIFSDEPSFVRQFEYLDEKCWDKKFVETASEWRPFIFGNHESYGPTFGCIPGSISLHWTRLSLALQLSAWKTKLGPKSRSTGSMRHV